MAVQFAVPKFDPYTSLVPWNALDIDRKKIVHLRRKTRSAALQEMPIERMRPTGSATKIGTHQAGAGTATTIETNNSVYALWKNPNLENAARAP